MFGKSRFAGGLLTLGITATVLVVGGCASPGSEPVTDGAGSGTARQGSASPSISVANSTAPEAREATVFPEGPLGAYRPFMYGPPTDDAAYLANRAEVHDSQQAYLAECMAKNGFEYFPIEYHVYDDGQPPIRETALEWLSVPVLDPDRSQVAKWGYGVSQGPTPNQMMEQMERDTAKVNAKNDAYIAGLSETAKQAYETALAGAFDPDNPGKVGGCLKVATERYPEPSYGLNQFEDQFGLLRARIQQFSWRELGEDKEARNLGTKWNVCMTEKGVDVSQAVALAGATNKSFLEFPNPLVAYSLAESSNADGSPAAEPRHEANAYQVKVALADFDCRAEVNYVAELKKIAVDLEQRFVDQHRTELDAMLAAASGAN